MNYAIDATPICYRQGRRVKLHWYFSGSVFIPNSSIVGVIPLDHRPTAKISSLRAGTAKNAAGYTTNTYLTIETNGNMQLNYDISESMNWVGINIEYII